MKYLCIVLGVALTAIVLWKPITHSETHQSSEGVRPTTDQEVSLPQPRDEDEFSKREAELDAQTRAHDEKMKAEILEAEEKLEALERIHQEKLSKMKAELSHD